MYCLAPRCMNHILILVGIIIQFLNLIKKFSRKFSNLENKSNGILIRSKTSIKGYTNHPKRFKNKPKDILHSLDFSGHCSYISLYVLKLNTVAKMKNNSNQIIPIPLQSHQFHICIYSFSH